MVLGMSWVLKVLYRIIMETRRIVCSLFFLAGQFANIFIGFWIDRLPSFKLADG